MLVISKLNVNLHTQNKTIINKRLYCVYTSKNKEPRNFNTINNKKDLQDEKRNPPRKLQISSFQRHV